MDGKIIPFFFFFFKRIKINRPFLKARDFWRSIYKEKEQPRRALQTLGSLASLKDFNWSKDQLKNDGGREVGGGSGGEYEWKSVRLRLRK